MHDSSWSRRRWLQAALAASACKVTAADSGVPQVRILFLGNSYTAFNGLPAIVGELLLSRAADFNADLIVMGAYGHSRLRELVLGGVTRTLLKTMTVPVLMSH